ncbi:DUF687 family protein [Chlamydia sp. 12-01]|uniref:DUF687 family protein n=1 Tax=Chlamydia sp. 12-01 TaxID=3002742 RepID=UPI0035D51DB6
MSMPIYNFTSDSYLVSISGHSSLEENEENQDTNQSRVYLLEDTQPARDTIPANRSLVSISLGSSPDLESTDRESVYLFMHGGNNSPSRNRNNVPIFEAIYESSTSSPILTPLVGVGYTNGSQSGYYGAQNETLHLSQLLGGREVVGIYNDGERQCSSFFCRRDSQEEMSQICEAILDTWESFFNTHPQGSTFIHYFFGNGAEYVQEAIRHTRHARNIVLVGICPSHYPNHPRSFYYRVAGDLFSCLDSEGFTRSGVTTLPYSSGSLGIFWVNLYDPTFNNAIVTAFMQTAGINSVSQNFSENDVPEITEISPLSDSNAVDQDSGIVGHSIQGVTITRSASPNIFSRIQTLINMPETVMQIEETALPPENFLDRFGEVVTNILRISDAVSILWIFPIIDTTLNGSSLAVSIIFFGIDGVCNVFLMLTNPRSRRERYRNTRIAALCFRAFGPIVNLYDVINNVRMAARPTITQCTAALYGIITFFGWTMLGRDLLEYALPRYRDALYTRCLRWFGNTVENPEQTQVQDRRERVIIGRENLENYYRITGIVNTAVFGVFLTFLGGMATFGGLELAESCRYNSTTNTTIDIIPNDHTNFYGGFSNGRAYAISQVTHMIFSFLAMMIYVTSLIRVLRSNNR